MIDLESQLDLTDTIDHYFSKNKDYWVSFEFK